MRKVFYFTILVVLVVVAMSIIFHSVDRPVFAQETNRFQLQGRIELLTRGTLEAYCDTGNGVMVYVGFTAYGYGGYSITNAPNGCDKKK